MPELLETRFEWQGNEVVDREGELVGKLERIFLDRETDRPTWALISSGPLGGKPMLAPLTGAEIDGERLRLTFERQKVWDAPAPDSSAKPDELEEAELYRHYDVEPDLGDVVAHARGGELAPPDAQSGEDQVSVVRSEEEVDFRVAPRVRERVRLVTEIVTEEVTKVVPLRREELRLIREVAPDDDNPDSSPEGSSEAFAPSDPLELTLFEEQVVVEKRVVPRERVHIYKETTTEDLTVSEPVRKERIDVEERPARG